ncbi:acyl carrier protein [Paraburkholderia sp. BR14263]|uniref:acyl carrier protein n=1 Tax=unclassified Paraburkholderia TaxID=2615204 RepID=UPI0034CFD1F2
MNANGQTNIPDFNNVTVVQSSTTGKTEAIIALMRKWAEKHDLSMPADPDQTFSNAGFDSLASLELAFFIEEQLGVAIDDGVLYDHPTFASLAQYIAQRLNVTPDEQPGQTSI